MFTNIGKKIKTLAKVITWVFIVFSVILGICMFSFNVPVGILFMVFGSVVAWVGSFILYGFGELIDTAQQQQRDLDTALYGINSIRNEIMDIRTQISPKKTKNAYKPGELSGDDKIYCTKCGRPNIPTMTYCSGCGSKLD